MPSSDFGPSTQQFDAALTRDALPSGTRLGGYQIIDVLGRGGFGVVYLALDSSLQRQVAIKEYLPTALAARRSGPQVVPKPSATPEAFASGKTAFLTEAKLLSRFEHPSLAHVQSFWEENDTAYMVMPYYGGQTLASTLKALPHPPDEAWLRAMLTPLLSALSTLHAMQCYHRDISPDNIFMLAEGRPVLLDFAASNRVASDKALSLSALLNPAYAPIEQYSESATLPQGPWTDLYALAGVLHFAITGQPPARATARTAADPQRPLVEAVRARAAQFPAVLYSAAFLAGIDKALSVKPRDRPRDVADFQKWLDRTPASAAPPVSAAVSSSPPAPAFNVRPAREEWVATDSGLQTAAPPPGRQGPLWVASLCAVALAALGGWWWTQMRPGPSSVVAAAPIAVSAAVITPASLPAQVPTMSASTVAPAASPPQPAASAALVAEAPASAATAALAPTALAPAAAEASAVLIAQAAPEKPRSKKAERAEAAAKAAATAADAEANNPRAVCGSRANFSLYYCLQTQCKRPKFALHAQCIELKQRGELE